ncbi:endopeptidase La [Desulfobotulus sp.]|jgi:ATP-dependent Lon protease|uniref:endopeptidase La n=1 Tax=Desulfobotulus sp. TaxID=1940337 RepID=UPI002A3641E5|nr:endopeptidase La [Desulfobotulus sp.]MDY0163468.1 endopeptidase La [Desulfobotulus sp.]
MQEQQPSLELSQERLPDTLPILPLHDVVLFPKMVLPLVVRQEQSIRLIDEVMGKNRLVGFIAVKKNKEKGQSFTSPEELYDTGCGAIILKMAKGEDNKAQLLVQGISRFSVNAYNKLTPYLVANITQIEEPNTKSKEIDALMSNLLDLYIQVVELSPGLPQEMGQMARNIEEPGILADMVTSTINTTHEEKQKILELVDLKKRLREVTKIVNYQLEILKIGSKIQSQVKEDMGQKQKEFYLRQQLKAIREELGETDETTVEVDDYRAKIAEKNLPEEARKEAERELKRLSRMHPSSAEYNVVTTYLDWMVSLPWNISSKDNIDIKKARKILDDDHYGLEKAKKRILEYLAVRKLKPDSKGPILCLSGPPGTGKTSLGRSIAKALGREFVRMALGGVRDEAEIRGHRRTYVGALPGRIIQALRRSGTDNPVFILDEVDKLGNDFRGDPSSALLEVLDPEQNHAFVDHYLDVAFDLSKVMFITTANVLHTIPPALRDRMEVIELSGYTLDEKIKIANKYIIPRQRKAHGINSNQIIFTSGAVRHVIEDYTREAGLRNLEREIASICRGVASRIAEGETDPISINVMNIPRYLGPKKIHTEVNTQIKVPGVAVGLAWTPAGGDVLVVETKAMKGKGRLTLTGQLGDVMKESVSAAMSFIRSDSQELHIPEDFFETNDLHIHVPAGAIPKDGPSAGVTMLTAITSLATQRKVLENLAMTGEITLRGEVLPVGGIKEKVLAAHRAGIKTLILPKWNEKDMEEIPKKVKKEMAFYFVDKMLDVLDIALEPEPKAPRRNTRKKEEKPE